MKSESRTVRLIGGLGALVAVIALAAGAAPALAQNRTPARNVSLEAAADDLGAGQFVWRDTGFAELPVSVIISLPLQMAFVFRGDVMIGAAAVSTGKRGKRTPTGDFKVLQKKVFHRSNLYSNAPMPYMQRLTWDGIALHAGQNPGFPASHGCIRLPHAFAVLLYGVTALGTQVGVIGDDTVPGAPPPPIVLIADTDQFSGAEFAMVTWGFGRSGRLPAVFDASARVVRDDGWVVPTASLVLPD